MTGELKGELAVSALCGGQSSYSTEGQLLKAPSDRPSPHSGLASLITRLWLNHLL